MKTPTWMPQTLDAAPTRKKAPAKHRSARDTGPGLDQDEFLAQIAKSVRPDFVARAKTRRGKVLRWIVRLGLRIVRKLLRKAGARAPFLAPCYLAALLYMVSAFMSMHDKGWFTILAGAGTIGVPVYWSLGGWTWFLTRRRGLKPMPQRIWYAAAYAVYTALALATAAWRAGPPVPGLWLTAAITFMVATAVIRRGPREQTVDLDDRHRTWAKIKKVRDTELGPITDLENPQRWVAEVDLSEHDDMLVADLAARVPYIAKRYKVPRTGVIVDEVRPGEDTVARLTVVLQNPLVEAVEFDESWLQSTEPGCFQFHAYPDGGARGMLRLTEPMSGPVNSLFSGDTGFGKSAAMKAAALQCTLTGRVYPIIGDPQGGQSMSVLGGRQGIAHIKATNPEQCYYQLLKVRAGMLARSDYLNEYVWVDRFGDRRVGLDFFDQDLMASQKDNPLYWPVLLYILDEAHKACQDPEWGPLIIPILAEVIKLARKTGIAVWLATQFPGIEELGDTQSIRQNLLAGNRICLPNSANSTKAMILPDGMPDPSEIPRELPNGKRAKGFAVIASAAPRSSRQTVARVVYIEREAYWAAKAAERIHPLDDITAAAFRAADEAEQKAKADAQAAVDEAKAAAAQPADEPTRRETITVAASTAQPGPADLPWRTGTVFQRCIAYMQHIAAQGEEETTTSILASVTGSEMSAVSTALQRAIDRDANVLHKPRKGTWALGPDRSHELVGAAA